MVTVNVIEDAGEPLAAVPVRVDVVLPVGPPLLLEELELLELPPPPHAAVVIRTTIAIRVKTVLHLRSFPRVPTNKASRKMPEATLTPASIVHSCGGPKRLAGPTMLAVVVFTVTVTGIPVVEEVDDVNATELGLKLHVAPVGRPEQERLTVPL